MKFSYRRYEDGDVYAINKLYSIITGEQRSVEQYAWQWLKSPAGRSEIWLIEADMDDGTKKLVGHHGVMVENFTFHGLPVLVGKTENTMVLQEYRNKLLYPRYERLFLSEYESRFHALFSTTGPEPAIRLRELMGYKAKHGWINYFIGSEPSLSAGLLLNRFLPSSAKLINIPDESVVQGSFVSLLDENQTTFDFDSFWAKASVNYGLTPARTWANLNWRFWTNPYVKHYTIKIEDDEIGTGIAVISARSNHLLHLDDIFCEHPEKIGKFIKILSVWARRSIGFKAMISETTSDCCRYYSDNRIRTKTWVHTITRNSKNYENFLMPRKITDLGKSAGIDYSSCWYVTPFFFEGK